MKRLNFLCLFEKRIKVPILLTEYDLHWSIDRRIYENIYLDHFLYRFDRAEAKSTLCQLKQVVFKEIILSFPYLRHNNAQCEIVCIHR